MAEAIVSQETATTEPNRRTLIKEMFTEMDGLHVQMKRDRLEIDRLSAHTRANIVEIEAALDRISAA